MKAVKLILPFLSFFDFAAVETIRCRCLGLRCGQETLYPSEWKLTAVSVAQNHTNQFLEIAVDQRLLAAEIPRAVYQLCSRMLIISWRTSAKDGNRT